MYSLFFSNIYFVHPYVTYIAGGGRRTWRRRRRDSRTTPCSTTAIPTNKNVNETQYTLFNLYNQYIYQVLYLISFSSNIYSVNLYVKYIEISQLILLVVAGERG